MGRYYSNPDRSEDAYALPDVEVFYRTQEENLEYECLDEDGEPLPSGFYYWFCFPGCLPEGEPYGPYSSEQEALDDCRDIFSE